MQTPKGKLSGEELKKFLADASDYSMNAIKQYFSKYDPVSLYHHWRLLIRSMDEIINIYWEIEDTQTTEDFMGLSFNFLDYDEIDKFMKVYSEILAQFGVETAERLLNFARMNFKVTVDYQKKGTNNLMVFSVADVKSARMYYQSRRKYYVTLLDLIPHWAKGTYRFREIDTLKEFHHFVESCLQTASTIYFDEVLSNVFSDFSIDFSKQPPLKSHRYYNLEGFFLEAQIMSMDDVMLYRPDDVRKIELPEKENFKVFSFLEVENYIKQMSATYQRYGIDELAEYVELSFLVGRLKEFCIDDFNICVPKERFDEEIGVYIRKVKLFSYSDDYVYSSNFVSLFQLIGNVYYSSVVLLNRFLTNRIQQSLDKKKTFQIHSGFVFEKKIRAILNSCGFKVLDITRIKRKEFDLISIKGGKIYNFQCKNNLIDICRVQNDVKMTVRWNSRLISYYKKAYRKELDRQDLVTEELGIDDIQHFVVSRYPVITDIDYIINFNELENVVSRWNI